MRTVKDQMNALVHFICGEDNDMRRQMTPQMVRRLFKRMSAKIYGEGELLSVTFDTAQTEGSFVGHPLLNALYSNGRRLAGRKGRKAKTRTARKAAVARFKRR